MDQAQFDRILKEEGVNSKTVREGLWDNYPYNRASLQGGQLRIAIRHFLKKAPLARMYDSTPKSKIWTPNGAN